MLDIHAAYLQVLTSNLCWLARLKLVDEMFIKGYQLTFSYVNLVVHRSTRDEARRNESYSYVTRMLQNPAC